MLKEIFYLPKKPEGQCASKFWKMVELKVCALVVSRLPQRLKSGFLKSFVTQKALIFRFEEYQNAVFFL